MDIGSLGFGVGEGVDDPIQPLVLFRISVFFCTDSKPTEAFAESIRVILGI